jgi:hypothetical protein
VTDDYKYRMRCGGTTVHFELVNNGGGLVQKLYTLTTDGLTTSLAFTADDGTSRGKRTLDRAALTTGNQVPCVNDVSPDYFTLSENTIKLKAVPRYYAPLNLGGTINISAQIGMNTTKIIPSEDEIILYFSPDVAESPYARNVTFFTKTKFWLNIKWSDETTTWVDWWVDQPPTFCTVTYDLIDETEPSITLTRKETEQKKFAAASEFFVEDAGVLAVY